MGSNQGTDLYHVMHYSITQISLKSGSKLFGTRGVGAVSNEIKQLHLSNTFEPLIPCTITREEYNEFLDSHLFLKEKRENVFKGIMVAVRNKYSSTIDKVDAASPTALLE